LPDACGGRSAWITQYGKLIFQYPKKQEIRRAYLGGFLAFYRAMLKNSASSGFFCVAFAPEK
jgi:hypothetical protein